MPLPNDHVPESVTKGLRFVGRFGYDTYNSNWIKRYKSPAAYKADRYRQPDGTLNFTKIRDEKVMSQSSNSEGEKREFFEWELHYSRAFKTHHVGGKKEHLDVNDFMALISPAATPYLEVMARLSQKYTMERFGKTISMFVPLYLTNSCTNSCVYCGFHISNPMKRTILTEEEIVNE